MAVAPRPADTKKPRSQEGQGAGADPRDVPRGGVELRLAIGREGLGLELAGPTPLGPLTLADLAVTLPGMRFPLDVSGGVSRFRHRRGALTRLTVELSAQALARWAAPRLRGLLSPRTPDVWIVPGEGGATVALSTPENITDAEGGPGATLAFEVSFRAVDDEVRLVAHDARGLGLRAPATGLALEALAALVEGAGHMEGSVARLPDGPGRLARRLLPDAGVRAPSVHGLTWGPLARVEDTWVLHGTPGGARPVPAPVALRAEELAHVVRDGDDARRRRAYDEARAFDLVALERAPRHRGIARRIAEVDLGAGGRAEAALALLAEAAPDGAARDGALIGELALEAHRGAVAFAAFVRAGEQDPAPPLAAVAFARAASLSADALEAGRWLDQALARAPRSPGLRWVRARQRLTQGRVADALADVEHLAALTTDGNTKHEVWRRGAALFTEGGARNEAAALYERALRYVPDDPTALGGLGQVFLADGRGPRGVALLARAVDLAEARGLAADELRILLARGLAEDLADRPAALARLRDVAAEGPSAGEARALEGRYRAALGDVAGATLAFARMRDLASARGDNKAVPALLEAATFERRTRGDDGAAQAHLSVALTLAPHDGAVQEAYRDVCRALAPAVGASPAGATAAGASAEVREELPPSVTMSSPVAAQAVTHGTVGEAPAAALPFDEDVAAARVDELTRRLQLDPTQDAVVDELAHLLSRLGRSHELLALLIARWEEATPERKAVLAAPTKAVLASLEADARTAGNDGEASLFRDAAGMFEL